MLAVPEAEWHTLVSEQLIPSLSLSLLSEGLCDAPPSSAHPTAMRDISFRDVLHALDQQRSPTAAPLAAAPPPSPPSPPPAVVPLSSSTLAMALLASASLKLSAPPLASRPIAIRPKIADSNSSTTSEDGLAAHPQQPTREEIPPLNILPMILSTLERKPVVRAIAPKPSTTPPASSGADLASASLLYLSPSREQADHSDSSADIKLAQRNKSRRKTRVCRTPGCEKYVVDHGLCIAHGGGKRCSIEDCNCRAQNRGLCWKHGGFTICTVEGCERRAKSRGICWSHGGGTKCKTAGCEKIAVSHARCWAHGGGKRCQVEGCKKPASERMNNCCTDHFDPFGRSSIISMRLGQLHDED